MIQATLQWIMTATYRTFPAPILFSFHLLGAKSINDHSENVEGLEAKLDSKGSRDWENEYQSWSGSK